MSESVGVEMRTIATAMPDGEGAAPGEPGPSTTPPARPALTDCLLTHALLAIEDVFSSSSLSDSHDPFGPTNLVAAAPPQQVMEAQKPIQYRTQTSTQQLQSACISMYGKADGILCFGYMPSTNGAYSGRHGIRVDADMDASDLQGHESRRL